MVKRGEDTWFFVTADYAFGMALERDAANVVKESGGKVLGDVRHLLNSSDFSSFLLQAQASKAKVVALANAGGDTTNALKQAAEFGITQGGQKMIALLQEITDTHALGAKATQGLIVTDAFYWDMNDETRAFSKRFMEKVGHMPTMIQAGLYSATMHYLKAIEAIGTDEARQGLRILLPRPALAERGRQKSASGLCRARFVVPPLSSGASVLEFERDLELGAVGFDLALGIELQIELGDFGNAKFAERLSGPLDRGRGRLLP